MNQDVFEQLKEEWYQAVRRDADKTILDKQLTDDELVQAVTKIILNNPLPKRSDVGK